MQIEIPYAFGELLQPFRYKIYYGGRGAARSWTFARVLIADAYQRPLRVGCFREYQTNIKESVHQVLAGQIRRMNLETSFQVTDTRITGPHGSEFFFKGISQDPDGVKSIEGMDRAWVEEAHSISRASLNILRPTVRKAGSELWFSMNTGEADDPIYVDLIERPPANSVVKLVTYRDNPWFSGELEEERLRDKERDEDTYNNIWEGHVRKISDAVIFRRRVIVEEFEAPSGVEFLHGLDHGFANDPTALIRCYITTDEHGRQFLWVDHEWYGFRVEIDELPGQMVDAIPTARHWHIKADNSRPETISYLRRTGRLNIMAADKWPGSVEDGIAHLKSFHAIYIHPRCVNLIRESRLYSYKVSKVLDRRTLQPIILPEPVDKDNHGWDALRYALDDYITKSSGPRVTSAVIEAARRRFARHRQSA